jgi:hypothetical protein
VRYNVIVVSVSILGCDAKWYGVGGSFQWNVLLHLQMEVKMEAADPSKRWYPRTKQHGSSLHNIVILKPIKNTLHSVNSTQWCKVTATISTQCSIWQILFYHLYNSIRKSDIKPQRKLTAIGPTSAPKPSPPKEASSETVFLNSYTLRL